MSVWNRNNIFGKLTSHNRLQRQMLLLCTYLPISTWRLNGIVKSFRCPAQHKYCFNHHIRQMRHIDKLEGEPVGTSLYCKPPQHQYRHPESYLTRRADDVAILCLVS